MISLRDRFLAAIGDKQTVGIILEGAILPIQGPKALLFTEENDWFYDERFRFTALCRRIRETPEGRQACMESDKSLCKQTEVNQTATVGMCAAGLFDIAVPLIVSNKCVASIFCGQIRPGTTEDRQRAMQRLQALSQRLKIPESELHQLWQQARELTPDAIEQALCKLRKVGAFLSHFLTELMEAENNATLLRKGDTNKKQQIEAHMRLRRFLGPLSAVQDLLDFRTKLPAVFKAVNSDYKCIASGVLTTARPGDDTEHVLQAYATQWKSDFLNLQLARLQGIIRMKVCTIGEDPLLGQLTASAPDPPTTTLLAQLLGSPFGAFLQSILPKPQNPNWRVILAAGISQAQAPKRLSDLVTFLVLPVQSPGEDDTAIETEIYFAHRFTESLGQFYRNAELYTERKAFLTDVTHQLVTPLVNTIDICTSALEKVDRLSPDQIIGRLQEARGLMRHCAMSTRAFQRAATRSDEAELVTANDMNEISVKVARLMIEVGKDFRVNAETKGLNIVTDPEVLDSIGTQEIDEEWVRHALMNVVDNAVKYTASRSGGTIRLFGEQQGAEFALCVQNPELLT